ncbi:LuxR C-terminal-related transcriptional regulator [Draconibacterium sp. IB214405]|uniref:LuxR C-terminal-related transcriptional regulator n=1 Tax=Draconibacterium sp. IB214405 TaxID=3097352 RepID=UPI002A11ECF5|nr:LuxR C-terminal-related transcriptional regulator [Draconibacterium sp. IB214405]MDX8339502.1 LuxR C-terminal-related transcriptional regulator [Draconibacterium sp. IB214405]
MKTTQRNILLIGESEGASKLFIDVLTKEGFQVIYVRNIEIAIQKLMKELPDLILCFYDLNDLNGFQVYNILDNEILKNDIPFIMIFNQFRKNEFFVAVELGIDSFIYPPFDQERIINIVRKQLLKNVERKAFDAIKFESICRMIPYGIFVADHKRITQTNETFDKLIASAEKRNGSYLLNEVFQFNAGTEDELKLSRFMNGLTKDCRLNRIHMQGVDKEYFNLYFTRVKRQGSISKIIGVVIPLKDTEQSPDLNNHTFENEVKYLDPNLITARERQVLQLSATGVPIKQIAERLGISERTVEKHRSNIIQKTDSGNIMKAVFMFGKNYMLNV